MPSRAAHIGKVMTGILASPIAAPNIPPSTRRWLRLGPWYAMFPMEFALAAIHVHTRPGGSVLDPFMGRGTTLAAAAALGRNATGIEINPVAWLYAKTKVSPANKQDLMRRLHEINTLSSKVRVPNLPEFYHWAFCPRVLKFLIAARSNLNWRMNKTDRTLMAFILVDLHGKVENSLSNQMRQTKSMSPEYAIRWWKERNLSPEDKDPYDIIDKKIAWRYFHGVTAQEQKIKAILGDCTKELNASKAGSSFDLLLTSPPYHGVINYNYDQWMRRWMLGGPELPVYSSGTWQSRFDNKADYEKLIFTTFSKTAPLLKRNAKILVRSDAREFTLGTITEVLRRVFPKKSLSFIDRPFGEKTQTHLFGDKSTKPGEVDIFLM